MTHYPVFLDLRGRRCVVLGGGETATAKVRGLLQAGAAVTVVAIEPSPELEQLATEGRLELAHRPYREGDLEAAWLAVDATWDEAVNARSQAEAELRRVLLNVVDRPSRCHFIAPAVVRRGRLQIAVSTGGESPFLAATLRARLEQDYGAEWAPLTALIGAVRRSLRRQGVPRAEQDRVYRWLLAPGVRRMLRQGRMEQSEQAVVAARSHRPIGGRVALVGAGPGDPGLLTLAGCDLLATADVVFHDALVRPETLALCGPQARLVDAGKRCGHQGPCQAAITAALIEAARRGEQVVRLKGGDPFVFGRGGEEAAALARAGIEIVVVPGVSSALAAPAAAGIALTRRGMAASVGVVSGHSAGSGQVPGELERVAASVDTLVVLMPMGNLDRLVGRLVAVLGAARHAALVAGATLPGQRVVRARLAELPEVARRAGVTAPATLVVGEVAAAPVDTAEPAAVTGSAR